MPQSQLIPQASFIIFKLSLRYSRFIFSPASRATWRPPPPLANFWPLSSAGRGRFERRWLAGRLYHRGSGPRPSSREEPENQSSRPIQTPDEAEAAAARPQDARPFVPLPFQGATRKTSTRQQHRAHGGGARPPNKSPISGHVPQWGAPGPLPLGAFALIRPRARKRAAPGHSFAIQSHPQPTGAWGPRGATGAT